MTKSGQVAFLSNSTEIPLAGEKVTRVIVAVAGHEAISEGELATASDERSSASDMT
jgi:hypothetical protein